MGEEGKKVDLISRVFDCPPLSVEISQSGERKDLAFFSTKETVNGTTPHQMQRKTKMKQAKNISR